MFDIVSDNTQCPGYSLKTRGKDQALLDGFLPQFNRRTMCLKSVLIYLQGPNRPMGGYPGTPQMQHGMSPMSTPGRMGMGTPHHSGGMGSTPGMHGYPGKYNCVTTGIFC